MNKKKYTKLICIVATAMLFIFHSDLKAQSGWYPLESGTSNVLNSTQFLDVNTGYMSGNGILLKTLNGGINWLVISNGFGGTSISFVNSNTGYVADGTIYKTTDGGVRWTDLYVTSVNSVYFVNVNTGYAVGRNSQILKTIDGGLSWELQFVSLFYSNFNSVYFINSQTGFVVGGRMFTPLFGVIYKTTDGGENWNLVYSQAQDIDFRSIHFPVSTSGYAVGASEYGSSGVIYKSTNSGETWVQWGIVYKDLHAVHFSSANTGYAVGEDGVIYKTTDGSMVWNGQISNTGNDINSVHFIRDDLGFTAGSSGTIQKTVNGGVQGPPFGVAGRILYPNGQPVLSGIVKALKYNPNTNNVEIIDTARIETNGNYILRRVPQDSVDIMVIPDDEDILAPPPFVPTYYTGTTVGTIYWAYSKTLYVSGNQFNIDIRVFNTTGTGGQGIISGGVFVAPPQTGGLKDAIVYTMIGNEFKGFGVSRTGGPYDVNNLPQGDYHLICDRFGYRNAERYVTLGAVNLDTINFYLTSISVIGIQPNGTGIPQTYKLEQNYPNPFNPTTKIKLDVPKSSLVKVSVYDMLGREIEVLVNELLQAGSYQLNWNGSKYSSGIYFYKIFANDFTDTKKMVLVK